MKNPTKKISLIVHGGAGEIPPEERPAHLQGLERAFAAGWNILERGGCALDAVEASVRILEDDPAFDAGVGAVLRLDGSISLDASIMEGTGRRVGAVACLTRVKHPITLARRVFERTTHVLLVGPGAEELARREGLELVDPSSFIVPREVERLRRILAEEESRGSGAGGGPLPPTRGPQGTVGAVARDVSGRLAAATSTGGAPGALPGRVGDTPIPGAGTYADDRSGAASATGRGENMIRTTLTRELVRVLGQGMPAPEAARWACDFLRNETGGSCGVICLGPDGTPGAAYNTQWMGTLSREGEVDPAVSAG